MCLNIHIVSISILDLFLNFGSYPSGDLLTIGFCSFQYICPLTLNNGSNMHVSPMIIHIHIFSSFPETGNPFFVPFSYTNLIYPSWPCQQNSQQLCLAWIKLSLCLEICVSSQNHSNIVNCLPNNFMYAVTPIF